MVDREESGGGTRFPSFESITDRRDFARGFCQAFASYQLYLLSLQRHHSIYCITHIKSEKISLDNANDGP